MALADHLLRSLEGLLPNEFDIFKFKLQNTSLEEEGPKIHRGQLHKTTPVQVADLLLAHYGQSSAALLTLQILRSMNLNLLAEKLHAALTSECLAQEASKPKSGVRIAEALEGEGPRALGGRRREPSLSRTAKRTAGPGRPHSPARQGNMLRRNASSAGRLQGFSDAYMRPRETLQGSGKKRPKSLELTIPSGDKDPAHYYALLVQEKRKSMSASVAGTQGRKAAQQGCGIEALRKGPRHPECAKSPERAAGCNAPSRPSLPKEKTCSAPSGKSGTAGAKAPAGGIPPSPVRTQDRAPCRFCCTKEGGLCAPKACSCSVAPGACPQCQASLPGKREQGWELQESPTVTSLSPKMLPQCERHPRQAQLLFCEDHRELLCLICSLSLGHQGHRLCPTDQAAWEYKEQIQKQLEHLKKLRKSGEEQRSQGDKMTASFLKATEIQKQKLRAQLQDLCRCLEQQEQVFVAWLEDLAQNIDQLRGSYDTRVSRDIAHLDEQIRELEAQQCQPQWELMQDIRGTLHRAQSITDPEPWATPPEMKEKLHLLYQKSEFVEKSLKWFSETLRTEMESFSVPELAGAQAPAGTYQERGERARPARSLS